MNKQELVTGIAAEADMTKAAAESVVDALSTVIQKALAAGEEVAIPGLGKFSVAKRAARAGVNPKTGEQIKIAARQAPKFSAAKALKDAVNPAPKGKAKK